MTVADDYVQAMKNADPDVTSVSQLASAHAYNHAFLRGFRACCQGDAFQVTQWGDSWEVGYKAAQKLGLFAVWVT